MWLSTKCHAAVIHAYMRQLNYPATNKNIECFLVYICDDWGNEYKPDESNLSVAHSIRLARSLLPGYCSLSLTCPPPLAFACDVIAVDVTQVNKSIAH